MKANGWRALMLLVSCSIGHAAPAARSAQTEVARFAATTVTADQGGRLVVSNVSPSQSNSNVACHMQATFYGSEGAVINKEEQALKPGTSTSIVAKAPPGLLRAIISIQASVDPSEPCDLITRLEIYDLHTGTTFISIASDTINSPVAPAKVNGPAAPATVGGPVSPATVNSAVAPDTVNSPLAPDTVNSPVKPNATSSVSGHKGRTRRHRFRRMHGFF
jgi:hypothetical protein